jgi:hypothetical protein
MLRTNTTQLLSGARVGRYLSRGPVYTARRFQSEQKPGRSLARSLSTSFRHKWPGWLPNAVLQAFVQRRHSTGLNSRDNFQVTFPGYLSRFGSLLKWDIVVQITLPVKSAWVQNLNSTGTGSGFLLKSREPSPE